MLIDNFIWLWHRMFHIICWEYSGHIYAQHTKNMNISKIMMLRNVVNKYKRHSERETKVNRKAEREGGGGRDR